MAFWSRLHREEDSGHGRRPGVVSKWRIKWQKKSEKQKKKDENEKAPQSGKPAVSVEEIPQIVLWEKAAQLALDSRELTKNERQLLIHTTAVDNADASPLTDAIEAAKEAKRGLEERKPFNSGTLATVQERIDKLVSGLETYSDMIDSLASSSDYIALVWGVAKFFFQILWNKMEMLERLQEVLAKIIMTMATCQVYDNIYTEHVELVQLQVDRKVARTLALKMGMALPELHAAILVFVIKAKTYFEEAQTVVGAFTTAITPFDVQFQPYVDRINEEQQAIQDLARLADMVTTKESGKRIEKMQLDMNKISRFLAPLEEKLNSMHIDIQYTRRGITSLQEERALGWLNAIDQRQTLQTYQEKRTPGTCQWILSTDEYKHWKDAASGSNLWICGEADSGKTTLVSFIVQDLVQSKDAHVLTVFFGHGSEKISTIEALSGLILQLLYLAKDIGCNDNEKKEPIWDALMELLKDTIQERVGYANRGKTVEILLGLFSKMLNTFRSGSGSSGKRIIVLLDALDACPEPEALFDHPNSPLSSPVALVVTSRNTSKTSNICEGISTNITFRVPMQIEKDVDVLIHVKIADRPELLSHRETIFYVIQNTQNTLRFANILLDDLASQSPKAALESLNNMQQGLKEYPTNAFAGISAYWRDPLLRAAYLGNHLTLQLLFDDAPRPFSPQQISQAILKASKRGHTRIVRMLLEYRAGSEDELPVVGAVADELLLTAVQDNDASLVGLVAQQPYVNVNRQNAKGQTLLTIAAMKGYVGAVKALLRHPNILVNAQEDTEDTALIWAAYNGHTECARLLLEYPDIDPNVRNNYYDVALTYAMRYAYVDVVRLLVSHPAIDIDIETPHPKAPIHESVTRAPPGAVSNACLKLLVDAGANVNKKRGQYETTLSLAAEYGYDDKVAILLTSPNLDRECCNEKGETPLMVARRLGHAKIVALLQ